MSVSGNVEVFMRSILCCLVFALAAATPSHAQTTISGYGRGCPGTNDQVPDIGFTGALGLGRTTVFQTFRAFANSNAVLVFGVRDWDIPVGGSCRLLVFPRLATLAPTDSDGIARVPIQFPNDPRLRAIDFYFQFFVVDPRGRALGVGSMTNGVKLRF